MEFAHALIDQDKANVIIEPNSNSKGFWFGGGNMVVTNTRNSPIIVPLWVSPERRPWGLNTQILMISEALEVQMLWLPGTRNSPIMVPFWV